MASRLGFRQHLLLLLFLDMAFLIFLGLGSGSFLGDFISDPANISLTSVTAIGVVIITIFAGVSLIGVSSQSNFAGVQGVVAGLFGKALAGSLFFLPLFTVIADYVLIWTVVIGGSSGTWGGQWVTFIALFVFAPLIVDAIFASTDWMRGVQT